MKMRYAALVAAIAVAVLFPNAAWAAVTPISSTTVDPAGGGTSDDGYDLVSFVSGGVSATALNFGNLTSVTGGSVNINAVNDSPPATSAEALAGPRLTDARLNVTSADWAFGKTFTNPDTVFFHYEINTPGQVGDAISVQGLLDGAPVGSAISITAGDYGAQTPIFDAEQSGIPDVGLRGFTLLLSDLGAAAVNGLRLTDNVGGADWDPSLVGAVVSTPTPTAAAMLVAMAPLALVRRRRANRR